MRSPFVVLVGFLPLALLAQRAEGPFTIEPQSSGVTERLRGVSAVSSTIAWASGAGGTVLRTIDGGRTWQPRPIPGIRGEGAPGVSTDKLDFRDVDAMSDRVAYVLSIGSGESSRIYKTIDGGATWSLQFANTDPKVFLDAIKFAHQSHGVAFSDAVDGAFVIFMTTDGRAWTRVPADRLPPALPGEGAFAASGSNVAVSGRHIWIGTTASRVLHSSDAGRTWTVTQTPLATGAATGIFSIAFRDPQHGVIVGGNYQKETESVDNVAVTADGGATWQLVRDRGVSGFRSAVAWVPGWRDAVLAVGPSGADWSTDGGRSWAPAGVEGFDAVSFAPHGNAAWASGSRGRIAKLVASVLPDGGPRAVFFDVWRRCRPFALGPGRPWARRCVRVNESCVRRDGAPRTKDQARPGTPDGPGTKKPDPRTTPVLHRHERR
jgi:photosystem II stability/assembly factor-like uncharacterized protein